MTDHAPLAAAVDPQPEPEVLPPPAAPIGRSKRFWLSFLQDIRTNGGHPTPIDTRSILVMLIACALLTVFYYYARPNFYHRSLENTVLSLLSWSKDHPYADLLGYWYWALSSLVWRVAVPLALILFWFRESPREYGFRLWKKGHGRIYLGFFFFMLPFLVGMSFVESFQDKYPFYSGATRSLSHFFLYEISYGIQFFSLEAFFRGFLLFALFKRFGYHAIFIMTIPYCLIHFGKPAPETFGSIVAGVALGYMALKSKSFLPGAMLHFAIGITMDTLCIIQATR